MEDVLGVDVGGVIMDRANDNSDTSFFSDNYLLTTEAPGALETLLRLNKERFGEKIYIVSKCGQKTQNKTLHWFDYHNVYERTGLSRDRVHFCRQRQEKAPICESLGISHFVDDRPEVISYLSSVPNLFAFQPDQAEVIKYQNTLPGMIVVQSWAEFAALLL